MEVKRHLTAISRTTLSVPMRICLEKGIIKQFTSFLDYGCGRGSDVNILRHTYNIRGRGYDPYYKPDRVTKKYDVVTCFFVLNVIECKDERIQILRQAYSYTRDTLVMAIRHQIPKKPGAPYLDGYITSKKTFQKYFTEPEVKDMLIEACGVAPNRLAPGIWLVRKE